VRLEEFSIRPDSAGPGKHRGGCGVVRRYKMLENCYGAIWFERSKTPAWGLNGGGEGKGPEVTLSFPDGTVEDPLKMRARQLPAGTVVETKTGGGGGNGDPMQRSYAEVARDVARGLVSREAALSDYGVAITQDGSVDQAASVAR
jgi:N-methylhydantoinase B